MATISCSLKISGEMLSNWYSHQLAPEESAHIADHIPQCPACQRTIAHFASINTVLTSQSIPSSRGAVAWRYIAQQVSAPRAGRLRMLPYLSTTALIAGLLVAIFLWRSFSVGNTHPPATATVKPTPTLTRTPPTWQAIPQIAFGKSIAFAGDGQTGYVCGNAVTSGSAPVLLSTTQDGGVTWSPSATTPFTGANCQLFVNPQDERDLVMRVLVCWPGCDNGNLKGEYRSRDGGQTWTSLKLPAGNETSLFPDPGNPVWVGNALYIPAAPSQIVPGEPATPPHLLAVSINGSPLTWTNQVGILGNLHDDRITLATVFAAGTAVDVALQTPTCVKSVCPVATSTDNGQTWTQFLPQGLNPQDVVETPNTQIIVASASRYGRSTDGSYTWSLLPDPQDATFGPLFITPDGTLILEQVTGTLQQFVTELSPGQSTWKALAPMPGSANVAVTLDAVTLYAVSWDAAGHLVRIWSSLGMGDGHNSRSPGITMLALE
jgi:hypothetical protein